MQAIKFDVTLQNGRIDLPPAYQGWKEGKKVRVILLTQEDDTGLHLTDLSRHAGVIALNEDPMDFQRKIRDEWA